MVWCSEWLPGLCCIACAGLRACWLLIGTVSFPTPTSVLFHMAVSVPFPIYTCAALVPCLELW